MTARHIAAIDVTTRLRDPAAQDAGVRAGHTTEGDVVLLLSPDRARRLAAILTRFEALTDLEEYPDRAVWLHAAVDLTAARAFAVHTPLPILPVAPLAEAAR